MSTRWCDKLWQDHRMFGKITDISSPSRSSIRSSMRKTKARWLALSQSVMTLRWPTLLWPPSCRVTATTRRTMRTPRLNTGEARDFSPPSALDWSDQGWHHTWDTRWILQIYSCSVKQSITAALQLKDGLMLEKTKCVLCLLIWFTFLGGKHWLKIIDILLKHSWLHFKSCICIIGKFITTTRPNTWFTAYKHLTYR